MLSPIGKNPELRSVGAFPPQTSIRVLIIRDRVIIFYIVSAVLQVGGQCKQENRKRLSFRPAATFLFESIAGVYSPHAAGVVLTGMGSDEVAGLSTFHKAGGYMIAQDEASCVVCGMPASAVAAGCFVA